MNNNTVDFSKLRDFIKNSSDNNKIEKKKRKKTIIILTNIFTISFLIFGGFGIKSILDYQEDKKESKLLLEELNKRKKDLEEKITASNDLKEEENIIDPKIVELFKSLKEENPDTVGWLKVNNTDIDTPIVKAIDNEFYLSHDFNKKYNEVGWAFADYRNSFPNLSKNTIIYGHTYRNSSLAFSTLKYILEDDWLSNSDNYIITFTTENKELKFKIFSIYTTKKTNNYLNTYMDRETFDEFIKDAKEKSVKDFEEEVDFNDNILTLSTCYNTSSYRLVVHAKLI